MILKSVWYSVRDSCDTVGHELWLAILTSLLCPEMDKNICLGKQGYVFILPILRSDVLMFHSWHQSVCQQLFWHCKKLNFLNKLISETVWLFNIGFVKFEISLKQWFSAYQDQFCKWFSLAWLCWLRLLENLFCIIFQKKQLYLFSSDFSNLFNASARLFCTLSLAKSRKILS